MDLSVIIVSWNVKDILRENLKSIYHSSSNIDYEVFVVDNNSVDGSAEMVRNEFPQVKLIANDENYGFARANNQAIKKSQGRYVLLYNPDMKCFEDSFEKMVKWMDEQKDVGVGGCRLIKEDGSDFQHVRRYPKLLDQLAVILKLPHIFPNILNKYLRSDFDYEKQAEVDSIRGSFFMIRREVIDKIGGLDERYFIWFEEVDYCRQVKNAGFKVMYTPVSKCIDLKGKSFDQVPRGKAQEYFKDSMLKYFKKWHSSWQYYLLKMAWPIGNLLARMGEKASLKSKAKT
ncbi:MAG: glycosyltransferase family 2 protein [Parcubacteria group bacterium]|nr:glycosyltransferase family 2 protein [Parcubacteria group bacterium]